MRVSFLKKVTAVTMAVMMLDGIVYIQPGNCIVSGMTVEVMANDITMSRQDDDSTIMPCSFTESETVLVSDQTVEMSNGFYRVREDITVNDRINISGNVTLMIDEGCTLMVTQGIEVSKGNTLTIEGAGTLTTTGSSNHAGIGADHVGTIIINGGTINATGGARASGIGGSIHNVDGGTIMINGGIVNALGGSYAAGIGGGYDNLSGNYGKCGNIIINGGRVTARGGSNGYGIGTGYGNLSDEISGNILLGWSNVDNDFIQSSSFRAESINFAEGRQFAIEGTTVTATVSNISGKKIVPLDGSLSKDISYAAISGINESYEYTGSNISIEYTITDTEGNELEEGTDFTKTMTRNGESVSEVNGLGDYIMTFKGEGKYRGTYSVTFRVFIPAPVNVKQTVCGSDSVTLTWQSGVAADSWNIEYSAGSNFLESEIISNITSESVEIRDLLPDNVYYVRVRSIIGGYESEWSNVVNFETSDKIWLGFGKTSENDALPLSAYYCYSTSEQIYTSSEIGEDGVIEYIDYYLMNSTTTRAIDIYMVLTDRTSFASDSDWMIVSENDKVFSGNVSFDSNSWTTVKLDKAFEYDGESNLAIVVDDHTGSYDLSKLFRAYDGADNCSLYHYSDEENFDPKSNVCTAGFRLNLKNEIRFAFRNKYRIMIDKDLVNGTVTVKKDYVTGGETVTLAVTPQEGYKLANLMVREENGNEIEVINHTFVMPEENVFVTAEFTKNFYLEGWKRNHKGWWYQNSDGSYPKDTWKKIDGKWYHFDENGYMQTGWYKEDDTYYYLKENGSMAADEWVENERYYVNQSGRWVKGKVKDQDSGTWKKDHNGWWYRNSDGSYPKDTWKKTDGKWYHFDENGYMQTGWYNEGNVYYYLKTDGSMAKEEWVCDGKYYVNEKGHWVKDAVMNE
ncbi:MAG: fibronectin type III domain-containing protein [Lachnospiraceae bacterium]|nr:fibronectin type III domain-containing protein [Lachnospiraceae bacterium]